MTDFRLLDTGYLTAAENMALDQILLEEVAEKRSPPTVRFLQFSPPAALVGYHQDVDLEIRADYCRTHGIDVNRRITGGGAIYFQESALGWELFAVQGEAPFRDSFEIILNRICTVAAAGLSRLGINARFRPRNDIEADGRKISGTGGVTISGGFMFQGTVLVENEVEQFLRALRVPVEKLKKREIESLMERICFLSDLLQPTPKMRELKDALAAEFESGLGIHLISGSLTAREEARLRGECGFYGSPAWIRARSRPEHEGEPTRSITQTDAGTMRIHLWASPGGRRVRQALIAGDFFTTPARLVHDLEASLVGRLFQKEALENAVLSFLSSANGRFLGIEHEQVASAVGKAAERKMLAKTAFTLREVNELFLINVNPQELGTHRPRWLLLPYCSKNLDCEFRYVPGCDECGQCEIGDCCKLARSLQMIPITVQSFEHLMEVLRSECEHQDGLYVGSCCEAFYAKHQQEMEQVQAKGILVNLDSTTCYDLGKGMQAYQGHFDNKTTLNVGLIEKTLRHLHALAG
jgi:lipoate-protein ligase A